METLKLNTRANAPLACAMLKKQENQIEITELISEEWRRSHKDGRWTFDFNGKTYEFVMKNMYAFAFPQTRIQDARFSNKEVFEEISLFDYVADQIGGSHFSLFFEDEIIDCDVLLSDVADWELEGYKEIPLDPLGVEMADYPIYRMKIKWERLNALGLDEYIARAVAALIEGVYVELTRWK